METPTFQPTPAQQAFIDSGGTSAWLGGRGSGRTTAIKRVIEAEAVTTEDAEKTLADLKEHGHALMAGGKHIPLPKNSGRHPVVFCDSPG